MEKRWISVNEAAVYLSLHPETVRTWLNEEILPGVRLGKGRRKTVRIDLRAVEQKLAELQERSAARRRSGR